MTGDANSVASRTGRRHIEPLRTALINPYTTYVAGFSLALAVYSLGYSDLYPPLQPSLIIFLLGTCFVSIVLAYVFRNVVRLMPAPPESLSFHWWVFIAIMSVFAIEILANHGIPLVLIASGVDFNYLDFGLPVIHVGFSGFCYFFAVFWFDLYLQGRGRIFLAFAVLAILTSVLAVSRGAFIVTLLAMVSVFVLRRGLSGWLLVSIAALSGAFLWGFGALGDLRSHGASGESIILAVGQANDKFLNSNIPTELFWPYIYASSPLANLQLNITDRTGEDSPALFAALELTPDFISKRLVSVDATESASPLLITEQLTVSTMYGRSFALLGWVGACTSFLFFVMVSGICMLILRNSKYLVAATGILSSLAFLTIFDNMYIVSGGILQVLVALCLKMFEARDDDASYPASREIYL